MDISVIIVNYNTYSYLVNCLSCIIKYTKDLNYEIIVVDNNSPDREIESILDKYPTINLILNKENKGFGDGCNIGAVHASGKYLLFINPDVSFNSDVISVIFNFMEQNLEYAVSSPIYIEDDNTITFTYNRFPGFDWNLAEAFANIIYRVKSKFKNTNPEYLNSIIDVDWVMGSFIFIRKEVFDIVKGFDTNYFLYYEDIDLQYRIKKNKKKIAYNGNAQISHFKRSSVRSNEGESIFYYHLTRSNLIYMYKHFGFTKRNIIRVIHVAGSFIRILTLPFRNEFKGRKKQKFNQYLIKIEQYSFIRKTGLFSLLYNK